MIGRSMRIGTLVVSGALLAACGTPEPTALLEPDVPLVTIIPIVEPPEAAITVPATQAPPGARTVPGTLSEFCDDPFAGGADYCLG